MENHIVVIARLLLEEKTLLEKTPISYLLKYYPEYLKRM